MLLAALVLGVVLVVAGVYYGTYLFFADDPVATGSAPIKPLTMEQAKKRVLDHQKKAEERIGLGHFALALEYLNAADELQQQKQVNWLEPGWLGHRKKEIALYADRLGDSLEELLAEAMDLPEKEWQQQFQSRYQNKAVILDTEIIPLADGKFDCSYQVLVAGQKGELGLEAFPIFTSLAARKSKRVLFGARLQSIILEEPGRWSIQFFPDSLVLLTDPEALAACCPVLDEPNTRLVLAEQKELLKNQ